MTITNTELLLNAIYASLDAGAAIRNIYDNPNSNFEVVKKDDDSPLTIADKTSDTIIRNYLSLTSYPILSEEVKALPYDHRKEWKKLWIVDPLDGTKEFIKRNGEFTVNIAFIENCTPTIGVIYVPIKRCLYFGSLELGAYRIDDICECSIGESWDNIILKAKKLPITNPNRPYTVVASRSHLSKETETFINELRQTHCPLETVSIGSSLKICLVCDGSADIYPRFAPTMEWDTAAGHAIACAAGHNIFNIDRKKTLQYNKPDLHNPWFIVE